MAVRLAMDHKNINMSRILEVTAQNRNRSSRLVIAQNTANIFKIYNVAPSAANSEQVFFKQS